MLILSLRSTSASEITQ
uniref:Uncharacterized protein n=1 Tax=Rhizophora mucronata TaxID=61149 RepID=A0A2P2QYL5_RHIMU